MKSNLVDISMQLHHETAKAIFVSDDGVREHAVWLAKSQVEFEHKKNGIIVVTLPEWMAVEKKLM